MYTCRYKTMYVRTHLIGWTQQYGWTWWSASNSTAWSHQNDKVSPISTSNLELMSNDPFLCDASRITNGAAFTIISCSRRIIHDTDYIPTPPSYVLNTCFFMFYQRIIVNILSIRKSVMLLPTILYRDFLFSLVEQLCVAFQHQLVMARNIGSASKSAERRWEVL